MTRLFQRDWRISVDNIELAAGSLDCDFVVEKTIKDEPNRAEISIYNLNEDHRAQLEGLKVVPVQIEAGYVEQRSLIYLGTLRRAVTTRDGTNLITTLTSGDGEETKKARVNITVAKGSRNEALFEQLLGALGADRGNADEFALAVRSKPLYCSQGTVLTGRATQELSAFARAFGYDWTIHNGALQFTQKGKPLAESFVDLTSETGLLGLPSIDSKGNISGQCLMIPDIYPGRGIKVKTERLSGTFRLEACRYVGSTYANDWFIDFGGKP